MKIKTLLFCCLYLILSVQVTDKVFAMPKQTKKHKQALKYIEQIVPGKPLKTAIVVDITSQQLSLFENGDMTDSYPISSSKFGIGNKKNSNKTPLGVHTVQNMIGKDAPLGTIFRARGNTEKIAKIYTEPVDIKQDLVTTRIIWLKGLEPDINSGEGIDSYKRYIYIHGTPEEGLIGQPASHGCIRMKNADVIELFEKIAKKTPVIIVE